MHHRLGCGETGDRLSNRAHAELLPGIVVGLAAEAAFFMLSGWSAEAFSSYDGAIGILREGSHFLRLAVLFGIVNLTLLTLFLSGCQSARNGDP